MIAKQDCVRMLDSQIEYMHWEILVAVFLIVWGLYFVYSILKLKK